jgi:hypothetical protein
MSVTIDSSTVQESASAKQNKARLSQKPPRRAGTLARKQEMMFIAYNIFSIVFCFPFDNRKSQRSDPFLAGSHHRPFNMLLVESFGLYY